MHLSLLTTKKKALLISMYHYAMMLTCHLTQNNVKIEIFYLCMVDVNFITSIENYYEETPKERDTVVSNSKICAHSLILFFQLCPSTIKIFWLIFSSHPTPSPKLNVKILLSVICAYKLFLGGNFSQFNLSTNTISPTLSNFSLHNLLVDILSPKM
jgi:hypothetical protein